MEKIDGRKVNQEPLGYLRERCIALRKRGKQNSEIARLLGLAPQTTSRWWRGYQEEGKRALKPRKVGRPKGSKKALTPEQERRIIALLVEKNPKELKFKCALWSRESVKALIDLELGMDMPISTVGALSQRAAVHGQEADQKSLRAQRCQSESLDGGGVSQDQATGQRRGGGDPVG